MRRLIRAAHRRAPAALEPLSRPPDEVCLSLDAAANRCPVARLVNAGAEVGPGQPLARGADLTIHAPMAGTVLRADAQEVRLRRDPAAANPVFAPVADPAAAGLPAYAAAMGLAGMGGSLFPAAVKLRAAVGIHTLVVNAVECEPGIEIDEALLRWSGAPVRAGIGLLCKALGIRRLVLAVKRSARARIGHPLAADGAEWLAMPDRYPAGAERLIVERLVRRLPPAAARPVQFGILVFSVASLWALGRRRLEGRPSLDRPLTLTGPDGAARNLVVPVGTPVRQVLDASGVDWDEQRHLLVAGGLMMGRQVSPATAVTKGTNAIFVLDPGARLRRAETPCIQCGSCYDACPLGLHPSGMADRLRAGRHSPALDAHMRECFLCGACAAVCPSDIPLAEIFREGKSCLTAKPS